MISLNYCYKTNLPKTQWLQTKVICEKSEKSGGDLEVTNFHWSRLGVAVPQGGCPNTPKTEELPRTWHLLKLSEVLGTPLG